MGGAGGAEPWLSDHAWRREGAFDESGSGARGALAGGGLLVAVGSGVAAAMVPRAEGGGLVVVAVVAGAFLACGLWFIAVGVLSILRRQRHGAAELRFTRFPYFLGEPLDATLAREGGAGPLPELHARLTCIEERWARDVDHDHPHRLGRADRHLRRVEAWSHTWRVPTGGASRASIRVALPPPGLGAAGTRLATERPTYWELELWADLPGLDFHAVFLVPIYQRPIG